MNENTHAAVFLDRDGTLNLETEYLFRWQDFKWLPGVRHGLKILHEAGYKLIVVTNQSGIARGYYTQDDVEKLHAEINCNLRDYDVEIDDFFICPHHPDFTHSCDCRKPLPGMLLQAAEKYSLNLGMCWMIGDKASDAAAGIAVGCRSILVLTGYGQKEKDNIPVGVFIAAGFEEACRIILTAPANCTGYGAH